MIYVQTKFSCFLFIFCQTLCAQPLTLHQAIQAGLQHNETILYGAQQNYLSAQSQFQAAESFYRPQLGVSLNAYRSQSRVFSGNAYFFSYTHTTTPSIDLNYLLSTPTDTIAFDLEFAWQKAL